MKKQNILRFIVILILIFTVSCQPNTIADVDALNKDNVTLPDIAWLDKETDIMRFYEVIQPWEWEEAPEPATEIYLATYRDMKAFDYLLDTQIHTPVQTGPIRVFSERQNQKLGLNAYAFVTTVNGINTIYTLWHSSTNNRGQIFATSLPESNEYIRAISSLAYLTSEDHPMYICDGNCISFAVIDNTAYLLPPWYENYDGSVLEVMYDKDDLEVIKVDMFRTSEPNNN